MSITVTQLQMILELEKKDVYPIGKGRFMKAQLMVGTETEITFSSLIEDIQTLFQL